MPRPAVKGGGAVGSLLPERTDANQAAGQPVPGVLQAGSDDVVPAVALTSERTEHPREGSEQHSEHRAHHLLPVCCVMCLARRNGDPKASRDQNLWEGALVVRQTQKHPWVLLVALVAGQLIQGRTSS